MTDNLNQAGKWDKEGLERKVQNHPASQALQPGQFSDVSLVYGSEWKRVCFFLVKNAIWA